MKNLIYNIKNEVTELQSKSNEELKNKIQQIKKKGLTEGLDKIICEWYALVQEISFREISNFNFCTSITWSRRR